MAAQYHSLFTERGLELLREAIQNGTKLGITHMSFGDGNGLVPTPDATFTSMVNEVYRTTLNRLSPSKDNPNWLEADGVIPSAVGGFNIREVGLWAGNVLVAYANYPPTYKPSADQGTAQIKTIRIVLQIDNTANFELKIDASVVMATIQSVEDAKNDAKGYADLTKVERASSIDDLINLTGWDGRLAFVKSYYDGSNKGGGLFKYDESLSNKNDGGIVLNGWVRQNVNHPDVYMFGAWGDWNAKNQTGHDDTLAFQKCIDYIYSNEDHMRAGGKRFMSVPAGNFRLSSLTLLAPQSGFGFEMYGEGSATNLWFDPTGNGINVQSEYSRFRSMRFNGMLKAVYPDANNPAIPYIFRFKVSYKYLDIDVIFDDCDVCWFAKFARVSGRGFTFRNGGAGMGGTLLEIACDDDLIVAGDTPAMHSTETSMRHFKVHNNRFDVCSRIVLITGNHTIKDHINGLTISNNEITLAGVLVESNDCTLISPLFCNNVSIASHRSNTFSGVIMVPRAKDVKDLGNSWNNIIDPNNTANDRSKGISFVHRYTDVDGLLIQGSTAKDLVFGLVQVNGVGKNVRILNNTLPGFGDLQNNACFVESMVAPIDGLIIKHNSIDSKLSLPKKWVNYSLSGNTSTFIEDNLDYKNLFPGEHITFAPNLLVNKQTNAGITQNQSWGEYKIVGDYIHCKFALAVTTELTSGNLSISLPVPAVPEINLLSGYTSGVGVIKNISGFSGLTSFPTLQVNANTDQCAMIFTGYNQPLSLASKTNNSMAIFGEFSYRFRT